MRWTVLSGGAAWVAAAGILAACAVGGPTEQRVAMAPISFGEIAGWGEDKQSEALAAFRRSCPKLVAGPDTKIATDGGTKTITPAEWKQICDSAGAVKTGDDRAARAFFEENFRPLVVQAPGKFTGYFEPEMRGSRVPSRIFTVPVYRRPADLTDKPYFTRAEIEQGALKGKGLEIAWVQDPVALYEVQVQGSGRVHLAEGGVLSLGFDGSSVGKDVITARLDSINMATAGSLKPIAGSRLTFEPLIHSSKKAGLLPAQRFAMMTDPATLRDGPTATRVKTRLSKLEAELAAAMTRWETLEALAAG